MKDIFENGKYVRTQCDACGGCCTTIIFRNQWYEDHKHQAVKSIVEVFESENVVIPFTEDGRCCFQQLDGKCAVHDDLDEVCTSYYCDGESSNKKSVMRSWKIFPHFSIAGKNYELRYELRDID